MEKKRNTNGTIKKGVVLNPTGRPKGTPNKTTFELKEVIKTIIDDELEKIHEHLEQLEPKERLDFITKLLPYVIPKQSEVKNEVEVRELALSEPDLSNLTMEELTFMERIAKKLEDTRT